MSGNGRMKMALLKAFSGTARAGVAVLRSESTTGGRKKKRKAKQGCTPCEAYAMVDQARERALGG